MADFHKTMVEVFDLEGILSNHSLDAGKETCFGISRVYNPSWEGWARVDEIKANYQDPIGGNPLPEIRDDALLREMVLRFYKAAYWDPLRGDDNPSQRIATELMDIGINIKSGKRQAVTFLQRALNGLNLDGIRWPDIPEDGVMGPATLHNIQVAVSKGREDDVVKLVNCIQGVYYMENSQEVFLAGLLRRVKL